VANRFPSDPTVNVPSSATAVTGNLTVTGATLLGYVALTPIAVAYPGTSTINFGANQDVANGVTVPLGAGGVICLTYVAKPGGRVDVILDITGYFVPSSGGGTGPEGPVGPSGAPGASGAPGKTVLSGEGAPGSGLGSNGDFYIDTTASAIYGPKAGGVWPSETSLVGANGDKGDKGDKGDTGTAGADGKTVLSGTVPPTDDVTGVDGDFYIDTVASMIYGPRTAGAWGDGTSLVGPTFADYRAGKAHVDTDDGSVVVTLTGYPGVDDYTVSLTFDGVPATPGLLVATSKSAAEFTIEIIDPTTGLQVTEGSPGANIDWIIIPDKPEVLMR
jgi:hypothetical protein